MRKKKKLKVERERDRRDLEIVVNKKARSPKEIGIILEAINHLEGKSRD